MRLADLAFAGAVASLPLPAVSFANSSAITTSTIRQYEQSVDRITVAGSSVTLDPRQEIQTEVVQEPSIADLFTAIAAEVPDKVWDNVPTDLSTNWRKHLYGN